MTGKNKDNEYISGIRVKSDHKKTIADLSQYREARMIDMHSYETKKTKREIKGTVVYCIRLLNDGDESYSLKKDAITYDYFGNVSGICKFVEQNNQENQQNQKNQKKRLKRFIVLNFYGIYNFEYDDFDFNFSEKFNYPNSIRRVLDYWYIRSDCTERIRSCIYDKYLLV